MAVISIPSPHSRFFALVELTTNFYTIVLECDERAVLYLANSLYPRFSPGNNFF